MFRMDLEEKNRYVKAIQDYYLVEREEVIGVIFAGEILDFFLNTLGKDIYNKALDDSKKHLSKGIEELFYDFDELYK